MTITAPALPLWTSSVQSGGLKLQGQGQGHRQTDRQTHTHIHTYTHTNIHTYTHTHIHTCMYTHTHTHTMLPTTLLFSGCCVCLSIVCSQVSTFLDEDGDCRGFGEGSNTPDWYRSASGFTPSSAARLSSCSGGVSTSYNHHAGREGVSYGDGWTALGTDARRGRDRDLRCSQIHRAAGCSMRLLARAH